MLFASQTGTKVIWIFPIMRESSMTIIVSENLKFPTNCKRICTLWVFVLDLCEQTCVTLLYRKAQIFAKIPIACC
jgi:hypothetical protein